MSHKKLRTFFVKVSVLCYFPPIGVNIGESPRLPTPSRISVTIRDIKK